MREGHILSNPSRNYANETGQLWGQTGQCSLHNADRMCFQEKQIMTFGCAINNSTVICDWQGPLCVVRSAAVDCQRGQRGQTGADGAGSASSDSICLASAGLNKHIYCLESKSHNREWEKKAWQLLMWDLCTKKVQIHLHSPSYTLALYNVAVWF